MHLIVSMNLNGGNHPLTIKVKSFCDKCFTYHYVNRRKTPGINMSAESVRVDFQQPEEMKAPQLCLADVIQHQRWIQGTMFLTLWPEVWCANVSRIGDIGR